ncbi:DUF2188 domain-containing protein [Sporomusa malonica]|uniref:Uncharacterized protein n=1 Tax=Sporomusa malonica TaxID=112901 RepID=A0A1W2ATE0_9FIRM|nr:DUF2188 domain-containing protein [Sporomusa malonica]SMC63854.1 hypothetical protein SAMN04488500_10695 [Sporomusa malonica]
MNNGDWTFNNHEDGNWCNDHFSTKEEAIAAGIEYAKDERWERLYVGQVQEIPVDSPIDADSVIEKAAEKIDDDYGGDHDTGDRFMNSLECGDSERLQELLDEAFYKWVAEREIKCPCLTIEKCERVPLPGTEGVE